MVFFITTDRYPENNIASIDISTGFIKIFKKVPDNSVKAITFSSDNKYLIFRYYAGYDKWNLGAVDIKGTKFFDLSNVVDSSIAKIFPPLSEDYEKVFTKIETVAEFPGGSSAWKKYLENNLNTQAVVKASAPDSIYIVNVEFTIDKEGNVIDIKALDNPGFGMAEEAVRVIQKSPRWKPAIQDGRPVVYHSVQGISFQITPSSK